MNPEEAAAIAALADRFTWRPDEILALQPGRAYPPIATCLDWYFKDRLASKKLLLPDLKKDNDTLALFSDYGGESRDSLHFTYSFLICSYRQLGTFSRASRILRNEHRLNSPFKEVAFKDLRYGPLKRALKKFLENLNNLVPGLLLTIVVDKQIHSLLGGVGPSAVRAHSRDLKDAGFGLWKPEVAEKMLRVFHMSSYLVSLFAKEGMKLFWMSDHDALFPGGRRSEDAKRLWLQILGYYTGILFPVVGFATPFADKDPFTLDLLSGTDLAAGALEQYFTRHDSSSALSLGSGVEDILTWLAYDGVLLRKEKMRIRHGDAGHLLPSYLEIKLKAPPSGATFVPVRT